MRKWNGQKWISNQTRLAIYLRDGMACVYCQSSVEESDVILTLDHLKPYSKGGSHKPTNLVTCCKKCNSARGNRAVTTFCNAVSEYTQENFSIIYSRVCKTVRRVLPRKEAREIVKRRGNLTGAIDEVLNGKERVG